MSSRSTLLCLSFMLSAMSTDPIEAVERLESWQSCCGAVCLRTVAGLLGDRTPLAQIRQLVKPNSRGETTLAEISQTARKMGFHAVGVQVKHDKLELCSMPLIVHRPPRHFVVLIGLGKDAGVLMIDPPRNPKKMTADQLAAQDFWNVVAISNQPISLNDKRIAKSVENQNIPSADEPPTEYGALQFENPVWYFGVVKPGTKQEHNFPFKNTGSEPVTITQVKPDCLCVKVLSFTEKLSLNQQGNIKVLIDTTGMQGYITKRILLLSDDANTNRRNDRPFLMTLTGESSNRGELLLKPGVLDIPDLARGASVSKTVTLRRIGYEPLDLLEIQTGSPEISATIIRGSAPNASEARIELNIRADRLGRLDQCVLFKTASKEYPIAQLRVTANVLPHIVADPAELFLGLLHTEENLKRTVTIASRTGAPFNIKTVTSTVSAVAPESRPADNSNQAWLITLTLTGDGPPGLFKGRLIVETDDAELPTIEIPFTGLCLQDR